MRSPAGAALASVLVAVGCARPAPPAVHDGAPPAATTPVAAVAGPYRYRVAATAGAEDLVVEVDVPAASGGQRWSPEGPLRPYVRDVAFAGDGGFEALSLSDGAWPVPPCAAARGCRLRYRVRLAEAARGLDDFDLAEARRGVLFAPPSSWLLRPTGARAPFRLSVSTPPGVAFVTGLSPAPDAEGAYAGDVAALDDTPYAAFGPMAVRTLALPGGALDVALAPGDLTGAPRAAIDAWIDSAARAVAAYYGTFPIRRAALIVRLGPGMGSGEGHTMGNGGGAILITAGEESRPRDFANDWMLVHEMVHLSFPDVGRPWAEEGLATYLEPIIRVRAGLTTEDEVWHDMIEGMPKGQPEAGDQGLDHTDSWGRRYWGGAMFWLLADLEIRKRTGNARSIDDALRAVSRAGGNVAARWDLDRALAIADEGASVPVLRPLRERLGSAPVTIDLPALWKSLGVSLVGRRVVYDDGAPLAAIRRSLARRGAAPSPAR